MSHASLLVALSPEDLKEHKGDVKAAVTYQMAPFDENGEWFADGSRWDWWQIGGRYTGKFSPGYSPEDDPLNYETCFLCRGTGMRNDALGVQVRRENPAYTCNGCDGKGKALKHPGEWVKFSGDIVLRSQLDEQKLVEEQKKAAAVLWEKFQADPRKDDKFVREYHYGMREGETLETLTARLASRPLTAYAFLRSRRWNEQARLGFFGMTTATECEVKKAEKGETHVGKCLHKCEKTGAQIISWAEDGQDRWGELYWARFIRPLPGDTTLVVVDYHV